MFDGTIAVNGALNTSAVGLTTFAAAVTAGSVTTGAAALDGASVITMRRPELSARRRSAATPRSRTIGGGAITFASTLDGSGALTINDAGGAITFDGAVGHGTMLASLGTTGATATFNGSVAVNGALDTAATGLTTFDDAVTAANVSTGAVALDGASVTTTAGQSYAARRRSAATPR